ncbi:hypothetical protein JAAARDRAFT_175669 [Jaapia argillacea MUCL 33604]|uniref:BTB domain-containing protein n=1 Tax=Jaapia argillacea MUCL 33604 TaxID=933084 RepID=A0A067PWD0_9AGAM|nr:hypothetical protein JAAARDRAFT_175669 [Jaapia argillacea MUCL 33604]
MNSSLVSLVVGGDIRGWKGAPGITNSKATNTILGGQGWGHPPESPTTSEGSWTGASSLNGDLLSPMPLASVGFDSDSEGIEEGESQHSHGSFDKESVGDGHGVAPTTALPIVDTQFHCSLSDAMLSGGGGLGNPVQNHGAPPSALPPTKPEKHGSFYLSDEMSVFQVENTLFRIHSYFFHRDSEYFRHLFAEHGPSSECSPIFLEGVLVVDFERFLGLLHPAHFTSHHASTVEQWTSILELATKWSFVSIRSLAIRELSPLASPIDKVVAANRYDIAHWLEPAYMVLSTRQGALTKEEGRRLGVDEATKISQMREDVRSGASLIEDNEVARIVRSVITFGNLTDWRINVSGSGQVNLKVGSNDSETFCQPGSYDWHPGEPTSAGETLPPALPPDLNASSNPLALSSPTPTSATTIQQPLLRPYSIPEKWNVVQELEKEWARLDGARLQRAGEARLFEDIKGRMDRILVNKAENTLGRVMSTDLTMIYNRVMLLWQKLGLDH